MKSVTRGLVSGYLERISSAVFDDYHGEITKLVGKQHGVYALYKKKRLYYVGLAGNLRARVKHHLKDRHARKWDSFSLFLIRNVEHLRELEALVVHIAEPKGNVQKGKFARPNNLERELKKLMDERNKLKVQAIFGHAKKRKAAVPKPPKAKISAQREPVLKGLLEPGSELRKNFKGRECVATVTSDGRISFGGRVFNFPSLAANYIRVGKHTNGWTFWRFQDENGGWVVLDQLRRSQKTKASQV
jgi:hypothetical protein